MVQDLWKEEFVWRLLQLSGQKNDERLHSGNAKDDTGEIPCTQSFNNLLLSIYHVPGSEDSAVCKTAPNLSPVELTFLVWEKNKIDK